MRRAGKSRRGNAAVEFALASTILIPALVGTFQFGYSFYLYNLLEAAVGNGARFGAMRTYRTLNGNGDLTANKLAIKNMVVYGTPSPGEGATPVAYGLATGNVTVDYTVDGNGIPTSVEVGITGYQIQAIFKTYTFNGKPVVTYPFIGRYAPNEAEP